MANKFYSLCSLLFAACFSPCVAGGADSRSDNTVQAASVVAVDGGVLLESGAFCMLPEKRYAVFGAFEASEDSNGLAEVSLVLKSSSGEEVLASFDISAGGVFAVNEVLPLGLDGEFSVSLSGEGILNADLKVREIERDVADVSGEDGMGNGVKSGLLGYVSWFNYCNGLLGNSGYSLDSGEMPADGLKTSLNALSSALDALYVDASKGSDLAAGTKDAPKATISAALSAVQNGQVIILEAGTYVWGGSASGKSVTIRPNGSAIVRGLR